MHLEQARIEALAAGRAGDWAKAGELWEQISLAGPLAAADAGEMATALRRQRRYDEADRLLRNSLSRLPQSKELYHLLGFVAIERRQAHEALTLFIASELMFGEEVSSRLGIAVALKRSGYVEAAEELLRRATSAYPDNFSVASEHAKVAEDQHRWGESLMRWTSVRRKFRDHPVAVRGCAHALRELARFDEAERELEKLLRRSPHDEWVLLEYAEVAVSSGDLRRACERLREARLAVPASAMIRNRLGEVCHLLAVSPIEQGEQASPSVQRDLPVLGQEMVDLFKSYESLGSNCEFGLAQRYYGAEPLGLLRWTLISSGDLGRALKNRFEGIGHSENLKLMIKDGEYHLTDALYGTSMHTFVKADSERPKLHAQMCRRIRFLTGLLLDQLDAGEKIFVYKPRDGRMSDDEARALFDSMSGYKRPRLLCVRQEDAASAGTVRLVEPGFAIGAISRVAPGAFHEKILYEEWRQICSQASTLMLAATPG